VLYNSLDINLINNVKLILLTDDTEQEMTRLVNLV